MLHASASTSPGSKPSEIFLLSLSLPYPPDKCSNVHNPTPPLEFGEAFRILPLLLLCYTPARPRALLARVALPRALLARVALASARLALVTRGLFKRMHAMAAELFEEGRELARPVECEMVQGAWWPVVSVPSAPELLLIGQGEKLCPGEGVRDFHEPRLLCIAVLGRQLSNLLLPTMGLMAVVMVVVVVVVGICGLLGAARAVAMKMPEVMHGLKDLVGAE